MGKRIAQDRAMGMPWDDPETPPAELTGPEKEESDQAFALRIYLAHGRKRTLQKCAASTGIPEWRLANWARDEGWEDTAAGYDKAQQAHADAARGHDPNAEHASLLEDLRDLASNETKKFLEQSLKSQQPTMSIAGLNKLVEKVITLDRLIRDQKTLLGGSGAEWDEALDDMTEDELRALASRLPGAAG